MIIEISPTRAMELLGLAVATRGREHVNNPDGKSMCFYERDGVSNCLISVALSIAGVTIDELIDMDNADWSPGKLPMPERVECCSDAQSIFLAAQAVHDVGKTWGRALDAAYNRYAFLNC